MGIAKATVALLFELKRQEALRGSICQLGRQDISLSVKKTQEIAHLFSSNSDILDHYIFKNGGGEFITDNLLFKSIGFEHVDSLDASGYEGATVIYDLNLPVPSYLYEKYDVIFNGGTLEHIFNVPQCLQNIHAMLKPGGLIIHMSPTSNYVDHGFYMFSPTFFFDYYSANNYEIIRSQIIEYDVDMPWKKWIIYDYSPGDIGYLSVGGWGGSKPLQTWFVVKKNLESSANVVPQQGAYVKTWAGEGADVNFESKKFFALRKKLREISTSNENKYLLLNRFLNIGLFIYRLLRRRFRPKIVARY